MFCVNCGKTLDDAAKICPYCGAPTGDAPMGDAPRGGGYAPARRVPAGYGGDAYARRRATVDFAGIGISSGLVAALIYWAGLLGNFGIIVSVLIAGYVLIREKDDWLRAVALKGVAVLVCFGLLLGFVGLMDYFKDFICDIINMVRYSMSVFGNTYVTTTNGGAFYYILDMFKTVIIFIRDLFLIICGFAAMKNRNIRIPVIDGLVDRHMRSA